MKLFGVSALSRLLVVMVLIGVWVYVARQAPQTPQSQDVVSAGRNLPEFDDVDTPFAVFFTDAIIPDKSNTVVQFPYYFSNGHQPFFLNLQTKPDAEAVIVLVDHPIVEKIKDWPKISTQNMVLYQKTVTYETVDQFLAKLPKDKMVVADPAFIFSEKITPGTHVLSLNEWQDGKEFDYFLTTYHEPVEKGTYKIFETRIDANEALVKTCGEDEPECKPNIMWKLDMPNVSAANKLYLGEVHVDFRQAK